jgi:hypothetical protein
MTNTVYEYDTFFKKNRVIRDFTSIYFNDLDSLLSEYENYFYLIDITEDERMENVAYELYGDENLADLLLAINDENFIWSSPLNQDILLDQTDILLSEYANYMNIDTWDGSVSYQDFADKIRKNVDDNNSRRKKIKVPRRDYLSDVIAIVNDYKMKYNENVISINEIG